MPKKYRKARNVQKTARDKEGKELILAWQKDFERWALDVVGIGKCSCTPKPCRLDPQQLEIANGLISLILAKEAVAYGNKLTETQKELATKVGIAVDSGKGIGKTALVALIILYFLNLYDYSKVVCTGPKKELIKDNLWGEISKWIRHSVEVYGSNSLLGHMFEVQSDKVFCKILPDKDLIGKEWLAIARTCSKNASIEDQKTTIQGYHAPYLLVVVDESYGVPDPVFEPLDTTLTGLCNLIIMIGNPIKNTGYARKAHTENKKFFLTYRMNGEKSTLVTPEYIERQRAMCGGVDTNTYRINVLGLPPLSEPDALIPWEWIIEAEERWERHVPNPDERLPKVYGCDIGGGGDLSVICFREDMFIHPMLVNNSMDTMVVTGWIADNAASDEPDGIAVDTVGIGHGVSSRLKELGFRNYSVVMHRRAMQEQRFKSVRDELFWRVREAFENGGIMIPKDDELENELAMLKIGDPDSTGRIRVLSKSEMKRNVSGYASPNKADALALSFYLKNNVMHRKVHEIDRYERARQQRLANKSQAHSWQGI